MEAMQANTIDVVGRMKEIAQVMKTPDDVLQSHGVTPENIEGTFSGVPLFLIIVFSNLHISYHAFTSLLLLPIAVFMLDVQFYTPQTVWMLLFTSESIFIALQTGCCVPYVLYNIQLANI